MPVALSTLLTAELGVRLLVGDATTAVGWSHSSDLVDPSPFLEPGNLLLTTGTQFTDAQAADYDRYVDRLREVGVAAVGFGTEVVRATPAELIEACASGGLPLLEIPYRTPFIAVGRRIADQLAAESHARDLWALDAQRALSLAALSAERITAVLHELSRRLGAGVLLLGTRGDVLAAHGEPLASDRLEAVTTEARRMLHRGLRAGSSLRLTGAHRHVTLHTLGRRDELRGVLAVAATDRPDAAATAVITAAMALAEFAVEDAARRQQATLTLNEQLLALLLAGQVPAAAAVLGVTGRRLPEPPLRVLVAGPAEPQLAGELERDLSVRTAPGRGIVLVTSGPAGVVAVTESRAAAAAAELMADRLPPVVVSREGDWRQLATLIEEGKRRLARADEGEKVIDQSVGGLLGLIDRADVAPLARRRLAVIDDLPDGREVRKALHVWLRHNAAWDPASRELGVHRHTLKATVHRAGESLGLDLDDFAGKAELWALLTAAG